jgi:PAS domain S-box-containing protein
VLQADLSLTVRLVLMALVVAALAGILTMLRLRDRLVEMREAQRLKRLAEASSDLVRLRCRQTVIEKMVSYARDFVSCRHVAYITDLSDFAVADVRRDLAIRLNEDLGTRLGYLVATTKRRATIGDRATLAQLAASAAAALETISLLDENAAALAQATQSRMEAEISRREIETILSAMSDSMLALDRDWRLMYLNPNAAALLGRQRPAVLGRVLWDLLPPQFDAAFVSQLRNAVETGTDAIFRARWPASAGPGTERKTPAWVMVRAFPHHAGLTIYMQDITRQEETEEQLRQTAKMDAIGQLTGGIAHDFNNLLTVIRGNLELLEDLLADDTNLLEVVGLAHRAADSASGLTHQLLAFARRQPLSPSDIDVGRLIDRIAGLLRRTLGPGTVIEINQEPDLWTARVDRTQLENAILNLAINARDAMPGGGRLTIGMANRSIETGAVPGIGAGDYVQVAISDTGCGIAADMLPKVFEPFFTTKPVGAGTGLGLSMVYGFVKQSGGHAAIVSTPGKGTTVELLVPRGSSVQGSVSQSVRQAEMKRGTGETVLVVEDAPLVRRFIGTVLEGLGYNVVAANDGPGCLALMDGGILPDLLLTDMLLPGGLDGKMLADAANRYRPGLPVLFMSGYVEHGIVRDGTLEPGVELLRKPFRRAELAGKVWRNLNAIS